METSKMTKFHKFLLGVFLICQIMDYCLTLIITQDSPHLEANPIFRFLLEHDCGYAMVVFISFKAAIISFCFWGLMEAVRRWENMGFIMLLWGALVSLFAAWHWVAYIYEFHRWAFWITH